MIERNAPATTVLAEFMPSQNMERLNSHMAGGLGHVFDETFGCTVRDTEDALIFRTGKPAVSM
jgi:hypothetical protein